jgi:hypothetical protein
LENKHSQRRGREEADNLIVSVLFFNDAIGDDARKKVPPILLKGTAEELDSGFFQAIAEPVQDTAQLFANMEFLLFLQRHDS